MILKPSIGIGQVKFGMTESEVRSILGNPDLIIVDEDDEDENPVYQYNELKIRLTFYTAENYRLSYIRTTHLNTEINGVKIVDGKLEDAFKVLGIKSDDWNKESYFSFNAYFHEANWLTLHEEYGRVTNIEMGTTYKGDTDEINWPD